MRASREGIPSQGNAALLDVPEKTAFLSSRRIAPADVLRCCDWASRVRDGGGCIVSGFQSPLEKDVLKFLLRGRVSVVLVLARSLWEKVPPLLVPALEDGRLLLVAPLPPGASRRVSASTALARNRWILSHCTRLVLGALDPAGSLARLLAEFPDLPRVFCGRGRSVSANTSTA